MREGTELVIEYYREVLGADGGFRRFAGGDAVGVKPSLSLALLRVLLRDSECGKEATGEPRRCQEWSPYLLPVS